ncbi:MAG: hypothetical protein JEZ03_10725 [Bacteroidales bacterium]|nr:hypothetical protein [Bacteroidales bacterium]
MSFPQLTVQDDYWNEIDINEEDLEFLYNHLLEIEKPLSPKLLAKLLLIEKISIQKSEIEKQNASQGTVYLPENSYEPGEDLLFPGLNWKKGKVISKRIGNNPDIAELEVISVEMDDGKTRDFAANVHDHILNKPVVMDDEDQQLDPEFVFSNFGKDITVKLMKVLEENQDIVCIAEEWFPKALIVDINVGHLNLAEAVLDMFEGGPLPTHEIVSQIGLSDVVSEELNVFSLNYALQEDPRFDEVGPTGQVLWFLKSLEPDYVQNKPHQLAYQAEEILEFNDPSTIEFLNEIGVYDELENEDEIDEEVTAIRTSIIYPHWRVGTIPLSDQIAPIFPSALEARRVRINFVDGKTRETFPGWVVLPKKYVYGLGDWYKSKGIIPGSFIHLEKGKTESEVIIWADTKKPHREWVRTIDFSNDQQFSFSMQMQTISTDIDERMGFFIPDINEVDAFWENEKNNSKSLFRSIQTTLRELAKLNPQGHVHAQELYAALNITRRCPPGPIYRSLIENHYANHLGDHYFRLIDAKPEE